MLSTDPEVFQLFDEILKASPSEQEQLQEKVDSWSAEKRADLEKLFETSIKDLQTQYDDIQAKIREERRHSNRRKSSESEDMIGLDEEFECLEHEEKMLMEEIKATEENIKKYEHDLAEQDAQMRIHSVLKLCIGVSIRDSDT